MFAVQSDRPRPNPYSRAVRTLAWVVGFVMIYTRAAQAADGKIFVKGQLDIRELLRAGGFIGYLTIALLRSGKSRAIFPLRVITTRRG